MKRDVLRRLPVSFLWPDLAVLCSALEPRAPARSPKSRDQWERVILIANRFLVTPSLAARVVQGHYSGTPPDYAQQLFLCTVLENNRERNQRVLAQAEELAFAFATAEIPLIFLKGVAHLLRGLYPSPGERIVTDIDVLVRESDLKAALAVCRELGYAETAAASIAAHHYPGLRRAGDPAPVELHFALGSSAVRELLPAAALIEQSELCRETYRVVSPPHAAIHSVLHAQLQHLNYSGVGIHLRDMYDCALLLQSPQVATAIAKARAGWHSEYPGRACDAFLVLVQALFAVHLAEAFSRPARLTAMLSVVCERYPAIAPPVRLGLCFLSKARLERRYGPTHWTGQLLVRYFQSLAALWPYLVSSQARRSLLEAYRSRRPGELAADSKVQSPEDQA